MTLFNNGNEGEFNFIPSDADSNSKIPLNIEEGFLKIEYFYEKKEIQFLNAGNYELQLQLTLSNVNEADKIGIKFGEDIIQEFTTLPIRENIQMSFEFTLNVEDTSKHLCVINTSDDNLNFIKGGVNMDIYEVAATATSSPISIASIEDINNKTITVLLDDSFVGTEVFKVYKTLDQDATVSVEAVEDSINPADNKRVIVAQTQRTPYSGRFETGIRYTLKITRDTEETTREFVVAKVSIPPADVQIDILGDRIVNVKFDVPVQNLASITVKPGNIGQLNNFYFLLYNRDMINPNNRINEWYGTINATTDEQDVQNQTIVRPAPDYKSMEIQLNNISIPVGVHQLLINFGKNHILGFEDSLKDFTDDEREVPAMSKPMNIKKGLVVAAPISVTTLSRTEIVVKFDKPVLKRFDEKDVIKVNNVPVITEKLTRVGNKFDTLKYEISSATPLPIGTANITVGRITDAFGYKTGETTFNDVPVTDIPPKILKVEQVEMPAAADTTQILVTFSKDMKDSDGQGGVKNFSYYKITKEDQSLVIINPPMEYDEDTRKAKITLERLDAGVYNLFARDIEDELGLAMKPQDIYFNIIDNTVPKVKGITFREKAIVIKFDEIMQTVGAHSITVRENYMIEDKRNLNNIKREILPPGTTLFPMKNNKWVRITLPLNSTVLPIEVRENYLIHLGYTNVKEVRYIEDGACNIYPLCNLNQIDRGVEELDISNGTVTVLSSNKLQYKYLGANEIYTINPVDFEVRIGPDPGTVINPVNTILRDEKTIEFIFLQNAFNGGTNRIVIATKNIDIQSKDIYGYPLAKNKATDGRVINALSAELQAVSLVTDNPQKARIRMAFNKAILHFDMSDFSCKINHTTTINMTYINSFKGNKVFELELELDQPLTFTDIIEVILAVPDQSFIRTIDEDGNKIAPFAPITVARFIAKSILWNKSGLSTLADNKISVEFILPVDPKTLIPDKNFGTLTVVPWDGVNPLIVPAGKVILTHSQDFDTITIGNNLTSGTIKIQNKTGEKFITVSTINSNDATLTLLDGKKLVLEFNNSEVAIANTNAIDFVTYEPYIDSNNNTIEDFNNVLFLYANYKPTATPSDV